MISSLSLYLPPSLSLSRLHTLTQVCLVMELAKGGEVFDKLLEFGSLSEQESAQLMAQVQAHSKYSR